MKVRVRCVLEVVINHPSNDKALIKFDIEENHDPGCGIVGMVIEDTIEYSDLMDVCWGPMLHGTNEILEFIEEK